MPWSHKAPGAKRLKYTPYIQHKQWFVIENRHKEFSLNEDLKIKHLKEQLRALLYNTAGVPHKPTRLHTKDLVEQQHRAADYWNKQQVAN